MALSTLSLTPSKMSYSHTAKDDALSVQFEGGAGRYRSTKVVPTVRISVLWKMNPFQYVYFWAFFRTILEDGSLPFKIALVIFSKTQTTHKATFVPGTVTLAGTSGARFFMRADLEVRREPEA